MKLAGDNSPSYISEFQQASSQKSKGVSRKTGRFAFFTSAADAPGLTSKISNGSNLPQVLQMIDRKMTKKKHGKKPTWRVLTFMMIHDCSTCFFVIVNFDRNDQAF